MKRFKNILVYVDVSRGKSDALGRAVKLARRNGAELTVVDIVEEVPGYLRPFTGDLAQKHEQEHADRLRGLTSWLRGEPIHATTKILKGRPTVALVREVDREGHDLLIKDAHLEESPIEMLFGDIDLRLLRNCPCPVWLVKPGHHHPFERVLAAIDPQPAEVEQQLNTKIVELASSMAEIEGSNLYVASVWRGMAETSYVGDWYQEFMEQNEEDVRRAARQVLDDVLATSEVDVPESHIHFEQGFPGAAISRIAGEIDADLIVMGTLARTGVTGLLMGNTAERILRDVNCSVLTLKPDGFLSPIV